jgi:hypothetical protein
MEKGVQLEKAGRNLPCNWKGETACQDCSLSGRLMCHFEGRDMLTFFMNVLPFCVVAIAGNIAAGYGWYLFGWLGYSLLFFSVWEGLVLCRHCPMWAEESRVLHCHANGGMIKLWKYRPGPMSKSEQVQFLVAVTLWIGFPFIFLLLGGAYLLAGIGLATVISGVYGVRKTACSRCVNFSCPGNTVPKPVVDAYLRRNAFIRATWEASGYSLDD